VTDEAVRIEIGIQTVKVLAENHEARNDDECLARKVMCRMSHNKDQYRVDVINSKIFPIVPMREQVQIIEAMRIRVQTGHNMFLPSRASVRKERGISDDDFNAWQTGTAALPGFA